jgi:hypothetical protein
MSRFGAIGRVWSRIASGDDSAQAAGKFVDDLDAPASTKKQILRGSENPNAKEFNWMDSEGNRQTVDLTENWQSREFSDITTDATSAGAESDGASFNFFRSGSNSTSPRSKSKIVSLGKWSAIGATGYGGAQAFQSWQQTERDQQAQKEQTERFKEYMAQRRSIENSNLPPEVKKERLESLAEAYQMSQSGGGGGGGGIIGDIFGDLGMVEKAVVFIVVIIIFLAVREEWGNN